MNRILYGLFLFAFLTSCGGTASDGKADQPTAAQIQKDTCDDPDANINCCFVNRPANLTSEMTIAGPNEQGEKLVISGTVFKADGKTPYPDILLYAYHTDSKGYYAKTGKETGFQKWHGHLHGWCKTDNNGNYKIQTIRPARYPDNSMPAHIHAAIKKVQGEKLYYISDFVFKDDSLVNDRYLKSIVAMVGGSGVVDLKKATDGSWTGQRNIILTK